MKNDAKRDRCRTLFELVEYRAEASADRTAYRFVSSSGEEDGTLTYGELRERAAMMASHLAAVTEAGDRVILLLPPGLDYVAALFACQFAATVAVPAYPPNPRRPDGRVAGIIEDSGARVAIVSSALHGRLGRSIENSPVLGRVVWLDIESMNGDSADGGIRPPARDALAFLQYTSGSTGAPRGVMLPHASVMHNFGVIHHALRHSEDDEGVFWVPPYHDMGLVGGILEPLYAGFPTNLMSPSTFSQRPARWLEALSKYRATTSGAPNFAFDLAAERITEEEKTALDLSHWRVAANGAEPVRADTIERFTRAFAPYGFRAETFMPCYGLAEITLFAAGETRVTPPVILSADRALLEARRLAESVAPDASRLVTVGPPARGVTICIVDPDTKRECARDEVGEIWLASESIGSGYWGRPAETKDAFNARLDGRDERFLRTGDLGAFYEGDLIVTGRLKDLAIVGGRNFYPQDIERAAEESHPNVRSGGVAAFSVGDLGSEKVVVVAEVVRHHREHQQGEVVGAVRTSVADALGVVVDDVVLIRHGTLPKTSSGKLQRRLTRARFQSGELRGTEPPAPPRNGTHAPDEHASSAERAAGMRSWLRDYARTTLDSRRMDERREMDPSLTREFAARGFFGLQTPQSLGGTALAHTDMLRVVEQLSAIDLTLATYIGGHNSLGIQPILRHGSTALRDAVIPQLARGARIAALAVTEPAAGSNPWAIESVAIPVDGGYRLHGVKSWIGSAGVADVFNVLARVPGDTGGLTAFALNGGAAGLRIGDPALTMGMRAMLQNAVHLDGVFAASDVILGHVGGGFDVAHDTFLQARLGVAAMCLGAIKRSIQLAHRYAARRKVASGKLLAHPVTRARLGRMTASAAALDTYLEVMALRLDAGVALPEDAFVICKTAAPELLWDAVDSAMQLLGGRGYVETNPLAPMLRDARLLRIFEGPTEPLLVHLGARTLREGAGQRTLLGDVLGAPDIADRVAEVALLTTGRLLRSGRGTARATAQQWASYRLGLVVTEAAMLASARMAAQRAIPGAEHAITVFEERLEAAVARCVTPHADERPALDAPGLDDAIAWAGDDIGDIEQRSNTALDPMLAVDWDDSQRPAEAAEAPASVAATRTPSLSFILEWLVEEFQLPPGTAEPETSLRDHGLDSLAATRLVVALETHLGRRIDASLLWRAATIGEFAAAVDGARVEAFTFTPPPAARDHRADGIPVEQWPEFRALRSRMADVTTRGTANPYFAVHEGISGATAVVAGRELLNFANYNYLGLSGHPAVTRAARDATDQYGTSVSASRIASGERPLHGQLESAIAKFVGADDAIVFVGGHATNVSVLSHLFGPGDLVLCDVLMHNSALQGAAFSGARWLTFPHNDWQACDAMLAELRAQHRRAVVVIEGVYSADGDVPDLGKFVDVKVRHNAMLMVDEAHSLGVLGTGGRGIAEGAGVEPAAIDILMGTLSKTLASCGGYVAGSSALVEYLKYTAPGFVYSVGISPPNAAAALEALRVLEAEPERVTRLQQRAAYFATVAREAGLNTGRSAGSAVIPIVVGDSHRAVRVSQRLFDRGINVQPMISPAVPNDEARLRFFISSEHTTEQIDEAIRLTAEALVSSTESDSSLQLTEQA
ncbi:MAG: aminotransferase class I/II-fold pyridoxal phosphate-dependent enzyme [Gemmatimonadota bacterium]